MYIALWQRRNPNLSQATPFHYLNNLSQVTIMGASFFKARGIMPSFRLGRQWHSTSPYGLFFVIFLRGTELYPLAHFHQQVSINCHTSRPFSDTFHFYYRICLPSSFAQSIAAQKSCFPTIISRKTRMIYTEPLGSKRIHMHFMIKKGPVIHQGWIRAQA